MRASAIVIAGILWALPFTRSLPAQPILNRVERFLRDQVDALQNSAPPAATINEPGYLGVTADDRQDLGRGVRIVGVTPGSPAAEAGLLDSDLITAIDGRPVRAMDDLEQSLAGKTAGTRITMTVNRAGAEQRREVTLGRRPQAPVVGQPIIELPQPPTLNAGVVETLPAPPRPRLGVRTLPVSEEVQRQNNLPTARGATVISVTVGSPAEQAGIPLGAVITAVDDQAIDTPQSLAIAIDQAGNQVDLTYVELGRQVKRQVSLTEQDDGAGGPAVELRGRPVDGSSVLPSPAPGPTLATPPQDNTSRVAELEARIGELEARIEILETSLADAADKSK